MNFTYSYSISRIFTTKITKIVVPRNTNFIFKGLWKRPGVWNVEEFDPDPFMEELNKQGLPWHEVFNGDLEL